MEITARYIRELRKPRCTGCGRAGIALNGGQCLRCAFAKEKHI